ncbi:MAG TPA: tripartite tricarboxylate transporter substrate binding protein [Burkholderiales bacterium]|nr:tripartite tricarboxylate transporter substrate binding protein [Burkholderiales bacterium]
MKHFRFGCVLSFVLAALGIAAQPAIAQNWPTKPVRIIVPFGAGGGTDIQGRLLSKKFYESMGQTFIVDNRPGASGLIGAELAAKSPGDGQTILFTTASLSVNATLYGSRMKFDPFKDLVPVSWISSVPLVLSVHPSVPAKSVKELIALAKKGKLNPGNNGAGTTSHLAVEMLNYYAGLNLPIISYKGGGPAVTALLSGEVDFVFGTALAVAPYVNQGKLRALAVTTPKKSSAFPNLPTMNSIYPGFEADNWYAMFFPAGTPKEIVAKLNAEIIKALKSDEVSNFMKREGADPVGSTPEELAAYFKKELDKYAKLIKARNIKL